MGINKQYAAWALILLGVVILAAVQNTNREWKKYQQEFFRLQQSLGGAEAGATPAAEPNALERLKRLRGAEALVARFEIKQFLVPELDIVDRCTTCHLGYEDPRFAEAPQPFTTHPDVAPHEFERFGCTSCHMGQGWATSVRGAAHEEILHWSETRLPGPYVQSSCAGCHDPEGIADSAPVLAQGASVFKQYGCLGCHKVGDVGQVIGPELTNAGGKFPIAYLLESVLDPKANEPNSIMPNFGFTEEQATALTVFLKGLNTKRKVPLEYRRDLQQRLLLAEEVITKAGGIAKARQALAEGKALQPGAAEAAAPAAEQAATAAAAAVAPTDAERGVLIARGEELTVQYACMACHMIEGAGGAVGPALNGVKDRRDRGWIFGHFKDPQASFPGTVMPNLNLSDEDAWALTEYVLTLQ